MRYSKHTTQQIGIKLEGKLWSECFIIFTTTIDHRPTCMHVQPITQPIIQQLAPTQQLHTQYKVVTIQWTGLLDWNIFTHVVVSVIGYHWWKAHPINGGPPKKLTAHPINGEYEQ